MSVVPVEASDRSSLCLASTLMIDHSLVQRLKSAGVVILFLSQGFFSGHFWRLFVVVSCGTKCSQEYLTMTNCKTRFAQTLQPTPKSLILLQVASVIATLRCSLHWRLNLSRIFRDFWTVVVIFRGNSRHFLLNGVWCIPAVSFVTFLRSSNKAYAARQNLFRIRHRPNFFLAQPPSIFQGTTHS